MFIKWYTLFNYIIIIIITKTSIAPISSKIIELSGAPSTEARQTHSQGTDAVET